MTKKKIITIILSVTGTLLILGMTAGVLLSPYLFGVGFKKVLNCKPEEITEIRLSNGNVGVGTVVTDPEEIKEIFKLFDDVRVKKVPGLPPSQYCGYYLSATFQNEKGHIYASFTFGPGAWIADRLADVWYDADNFMTEQETDAFIEKYHIGEEDAQKRREERELIEQILTEQKQKQQTAE